MYIHAIHNTTMQTQESRNPLAHSPRRVQTTSGLVESQEVLVRWATSADNLCMPDYHKYDQRHLNLPLNMHSES